MKTETVLVPAAAPREGLGEDAEDLEHEGGADQGRVARGVEGRRHLDHIAADQVEAAQAADHLLGVEGRVAADLRRAGAGREDRS